MRSKGLLFLLLSFFFLSTLRSQSNELIVKGQTGKLYLEHTVVAKENWYSIGRLYNISPKEIAPFNNLSLDKSLSIGELLQIPLTTVNFSQDKQKTAAETLVPVYYIIQEKEWMYRISVNHNKVPIPDLEKWNNITGDQVKAGMPIIVGFLKVKTALSALASGVAGAPVAAAVPSGGGTPSGAVTAGAGTSGVATPRPAAPAVAGAQSPVVTGVQAPAASPAGASTVAASGQKALSDQPTSDAKGAGSGSGAPAGVASNGVNAGNVGTAATVAPATAPAVAAPVPVPAAVATNKPAVAAPVSAAPAINFNGGYFKSDFSNTSNSVSGLAGTFKSTSGWKDGKYYALMNNVPVGTIVKITIPATSKSIYAKVLGQLPDMKESAGLTVRISNSAAGELGGGDGRFAVEVRY